MTERYDYWAEIGGQKPAEISQASRDAMARIGLGDKRDIAALNRDRELAAKRVEDAHYRDAAAEGVKLWDEADPDPVRAAGIDSPDPRVREDAARRQIRKNRGRVA